MEDAKKLAGGSERKGTGGEGEGISPITGLPVPPAPSKEEAEKLRKQKLSYDLHVLLIQEERDCTSSVACFRAWLEGPTGLTLRLKRPATP